MDPSRGWNLLVLFILLCLSAFFSASETAILAVNRIRMKTLAEDGNKKAEIVLKLLEDVDAILTSVLIGNNIVNLSAASLATVIAVDIFGSAGAGIATGVLTFLILVFSEITPKSLANRYATNISLAVAKPIYYYKIFLKPLAFILGIISQFFVRLLKADSEEGPTLTEEELKTYVNVSHEEGILEEEEKDMIHNVFEFGDTEIREIMTPRIHVISLPCDVSYQEMISIYREEKFSRMPIVNDSYDQVLGVLYVKDIFLEEFDEENFNVLEFVREPFFVYEFNHLSDVFTRMKKARVTLAVVLDEYGLLTGIVTLEDIVEEIVGEITDEYDEVENVISKIDDYTYFIDGSVSFLEINEVVGTNFESEEFESIGGLVLGEIEGEPRVGTEIRINDYTLRIEKINKNRIEVLKLIIPKEE